MIARALHDAGVLRDAGFSAVIVENLGDAPFDPGPGEPHVIAHMAVVASMVRRVHGASLVVGINVLRNAPLAALGIASAVGADFIRVNVHVGAMVTDQGLLEGRARDTLLYRRRLGLECAIAADVQAALTPAPAAAERPELFFKSLPEKVVGPGEAVGTSVVIDNCSFSAFGNEEGCLVYCYQMPNLIAVRNGQLLAAAAEPSSFSISVIPKSMFT